MNPDHPPLGVRPETSTRISTRIGGLLPALGGWVVGLLLAFYPILLSGFARVPGDESDPRLLNYILEHGYRWVTGDPRHGDFWSPPIFYPARNTAAYSDVLFSAGPFYWMWRLLGFAPDTSFQLWYLTIGSLNYWSAYALLRNCLRLSFVAAALGAFLFAFGGSRLGQMLHAQLHLHFFTVLGVYALFRLFEYVSVPEKGDGTSKITGPVPFFGHGRRTAARIWIVVFGLAVVAQLYASFYLGWFLGLGLLAVGLWALILPAARKPLLAVVKTYPITITFSIALSAGLLLPMAIHYLEAAREVGMFPFERDWVPMWQTWLYMGDTSWLYGRLKLFEPAHIDAFHRGGHRMGLGLFTTLLAALGLYRARGWTAVRLLVLGSGTVALLVMTFGSGFSFWRFLFPYVPGAGAIRALCRIGLMMLLPASVGVACAVQFSTRRWVVAAIGLLCVLEQGRFVDGFDKYQVRRDVRAVAEQIDPHSRAFFYAYIVPPDKPPGSVKLQLDAMEAQLASGVPTVNGYSGKLPPGWQDQQPRLGSGAEEPNPGLFFIRVCTEADRQRLDKALRAWRARHGLKEADIQWITTRRNP